MASLQRDDNWRSITSNDAFVSTKTMTFAGGTTNDPGDFDGTGNPATLFTVTGDVLVNIFAICTVDLVGATATVEVGVSGSTAALCDQQTATNIDNHEVWHDAVLAVGGSVAGHSHAINQNIIQTVGTANITAGSLTYYCQWRPLSTGANVEAA